MRGEQKADVGADEFQQRLKSLGYLENPLDKFFIGRAHGRGGVLLANLKIALKVGILGGIFLGLVTAMGLALLSPESFVSFTALAKLTAYFCLIFIILFTALELAICLAATFLGKILRRLFTRTEMIALYGGVFAALAVLLYGTLWWWAAGPQAPLVSARSAAAFLVIAAVAAAIAFLTRLGITALLALLGGADLGARGKGRGTKLYFALLAAGVAIFAGYRLLTAERPPQNPSEFQRESTGVTVTLVAVDGGGLDFFDLLCQKGVLPNLSRLRDEGCTAIIAQPSLHVNPAVWTTVATGVAPRKHGVTAYSAQEIPGLGFYVRERVGFGLYDALLSALPAVGLSRRSPLERRSVAYPHLWDILRLRGELSGVVNWWGTWPADDFHGYLVTDRMYPKLQVARLAGRTPAFESEVYPEALFAELRDYVLDGARMADDPLAAARDIDRFAVTAVLTARQDYPDIALTAVYLPGLDIYANSLYGGEGPRGLVHQALVLEGIEGYWRFLDRLLEPLLKARAAGEVVMLAADPGMLKGPERRPPGRSERGFVVFSGGPVKRGGICAPLALADMAPAVLYLLGFPVSAEMDGRVPECMVEEAFLAAHPVRTVETFGRLEITRGGDYSVDRDLVERLRSLGYLQQ